MIAERDQLVATVRVLAEAGQGAMLTRIHGEKIAVLESQIDAQRHQLDRMDHKLDRLLERQKGND